MPSTQNSGFEKRQALHIQTLIIPDVKVLSPPKLGDRRGFFSEVYSRRTLADAGIGIYLAKPITDFFQRSMREE